MPIKSNIDQFIRETKKEVEKELEKQKSFAKKVILESHNKLVRESAVDTGLYRSNHLISVNSPIPEPQLGLDNTRISRQALQIGTFNFNNGDRITISNSLSYSTALEAGRSRQQEANLYGRTEQFAKSLLNRKL